MDVALREVLAAFGRGEGELLSDTRRGLVRKLEHPALGPVVVKELRPRRGLRGLRERLRRLWGDTRARRAETAARRLRSLGLPVPEPLGREEAGGRSLLVTRWIPGTPLRGGPHAWPAAVGALVARLHEAGVAHGDLKPANLLLSEEGVGLLDLDRVRVGSGPLPVSQRVRDLRPLARAGWLGSPGWARYAASSAAADEIRAALERWLAHLERT